ncbi:Ctr-domain-containing protein [Zopfia rhizophila CBS 207.26]|uniref:Copper transport protein n=1 Tax=Zopfia rhizophila CBS 207.26 TaxID=1314779 RepID=A0A6A6EWL9_9PEZI|nr:Ctr-domain-containing protein [Zopfia rhizophila CBS 207.26]
MDHNRSGMSSMTMAMSATGTGMAMPTSTAAMSGGHGGMSMGGSCKISMLWNWYTIDSCFLARSWHVTSKGMFAGSCIGVILLVISLEFLRRAGKEYDRYIISQYSRSLAPAQNASSSSSTNNDIAKGASANVAGAACIPTTQRFRPNLLQQAVRALLHMLQFAVAYFVMLLAMYYNGYIIICIFIGAYLGYFIFGWEIFQVSAGGKDRMEEQVTVCCG